MGQIRKFISNNKGILAASSVFISGTGIDYFLTINGLETSSFQEGNPLLQSYLTHFEPEIGILIPKILIGSSILSGMIVVDAYHKRQGKKKQLPKLVLYAGGIIQTLAGLSWYLG